MIKLYNEKAIKNHLKDGYAFRPADVGFILVYGGAVQVEVNQQPLQQPPSLILLSVGNIYKFLSLSPDVKLYIVSFDKKKLRQRINFSFNGYNSFRILHAGRAPGTLVLQLPQPRFEHLLELCRQLEFYLAGSNNGAFTGEIITGLSSVMGFSIADEIFHHFQQDENRNLRKEEITVNFLKLVSEHFKEEKELKFYADKLFVSVKYLSNCVREVTHLPPTLILAEALVNEAKELLLNTSQPVYAIAAELNFSDQYAFGKFFKKHTGHSPLNFRKQNQRIDTI